MRSLAPVFVAFAACALIACGSEGSNGDNATGGVGGSGCPEGQLQFEGKCVDSVGRYEPAERIDFDNVRNYGPAPTLDLPDPPKSGFRLVITSDVLPPGEDIEYCRAWEYPQFTYKNVYAARLYTSGGLHHSNMYGVPLSADGPSPYPECNPGQSDVFTQVNNWFAGNIMDVLFANSTQVEGGEAVVFPPGMAFKITTDSREVASSIHFLNATADPFASQIVYDFYTMPDDQVQQEIVPFVFENEGFSIPAQTTGDIATTCNITMPPGNIVSIMPHTHKRATSFTVDLLDSNGAATRIFEDGAFDTESDITVFSEPISMDGFASIRHVCTVQNDLSVPIVWGIGDNEMCTLFGYLFPPEAQQVGFVGAGATDCAAFNIGQYR